MYNFALTKIVSIQNDIKQIKKKVKPQTIRNIYKSCIGQRTYISNIKLLGDNTPEYFHIST